MPVKFTVEQQGSRWVASGGTTHAEADYPDEAVLNLVELLGSTEEQREAAESRRPIEEAERRVGDRALALIRLLALGAPAAIVRNEARLVGKFAEDWIAAREEAGT